MAIGKISDLFAGRGVSHAVHTANDDEVMDAVGEAIVDTPSGLIFANLVDFDTQYGHRNDVAGYAAEPGRFDARLTALLPALDQSDLLVITADHGNDPTTPSTDHSRECVCRCWCAAAQCVPGPTWAPDRSPTWGRRSPTPSRCPALAAGTSVLPQLRAS